MANRRAKARKARRAAALAQVVNTMRVATAREKSLENMMNGLKITPKKKRRSKKQKNNQMIPLPLNAPTFEQIQRNMRRTVPPRVLGNSWAHCRMDPFSSSGGVRKPDGRGAGRSIIVDHLISETITFNTSSGFTIQTFPGMLPYTAAIVGNGAAGVNDFTVNTIGGSYNFINPVATGTNWFPLGNVNEWLQGNPVKYASNSGGVPNQNDPYVSSDMRVLSVKRYLQYSGNLTSDQGWISVSPSPFRLSKNFNEIDALSAGNGLVNGVATAFNSNTSLSIPVGVPYYSLDLENPTTTVFNKDTVQHRMDVALSIVSKQKGDIHDFAGVPDTGFLVCPNASLVSNTGAPTVVYPNWCSFNSTPAVPLVWAIAESWIGELINVTGVSVGASMKFLTAICVEYVPQSNSPMAPLAVKPAPANVGLVDRVNDMVNAMPVAVPSVSEKAFMPNRGVPRM